VDWSKLAADLLDEKSLLATPRHQSEPREGRERQRKNGINRSGRTESKNPCASLDNTTFFSWIFASWNKQ